MRHLRLVVLLILAGIPSIQAQGMASYLPMNPGAVPQVGKWTVANSGSNFLITKPDGTTSTVAKAAATTQSVTVFTLPANSKLIACDIKTGTAFTGTTTLTSTLGVTGNLTGCISVAFDLKAAVSNTNLSSALLTTPIVSVAGTDVILALTSTVDNLSSISAGSLTIWLTSMVLP